MKSIGKKVAAAGVLVLALVLGGLALASRSKVRSWERSSQTSLELYEKGRFSEALRPGEEALRLAQEGFSPSDIRTLLSKELVGKVLARTGGLSRSHELLVEAERASKEVFGQGSVRRARFLSSLAEVKAARGEFDEAEELHQEVLRLVQGEHGIISGPTALAFARLGGLYMDWGLYEQAEPVFNRAGAILLRTGLTDRGLSAFMDAELCRIMVESGRLRDAQSACPSSLSARQAMAPPDHPDLARSLTASGLFHLRSGRLDKARRHLEAALKAFDAEPKADLRGREGALLAMAELKAGQGDLSSAEQSFAEVRTASDSPYATVKTLIREAGCELRGGQAKRAAGALREALSLHDELPLADKLDRELILFGLGEAHASQGLYDQAEGYLSDALEAAEERHGRGVEDMISALAALGRVQAAGKRYSKAEATARRLSELGDGYGRSNPTGRRARDAAAGIRRALAGRGRS
ncbi:MAG: tetratricopeptide repeat protein [Elusimicrobia bacterium]|nr:tetratricopeptide repeat protein [Elusimicrobiota bacterium]